MTMKDWAIRGVQFLLSVMMIVRCTLSDDHPQQEQNTHTDKFDYEDFDNMPGIQHEFKVDVGAGTAECFFQRMKQGAQLHVSFEVLRGADRNIDVYIKRPDGNVHAKHLWTNEGNTDTVVPWEGDYAICIDNGFSRFSTKLVYLFIATYVPKEWEQFAEEAEALDVSLNAVQGSMDALRKNVAKSTHLMGLGRVRSSSDQYQAANNNKTVQNMSITLIFIFIMSSAIQVYFVRNMFKTVNVTPTQKPRA